MNKFNRIMTFIAGGALALSLLVNAAALGAYIMFTKKQDEINRLNRHYHDNYTEVEFTLPAGVVAKEG